MQLLMSSTQPTCDPEMQTTRVWNFADDTYLIVPAQGSENCHAELKHIHA